MASKKIHHVLVFIAAIALLVSGCGGGTATAPSIPVTASLSEVAGTVNAKNPGAADFSAASNGFMLDVEGQVSTGEDGRVRLDLSTGTVVRLASNTIFTLVSNEPQSDSLLTRIKLEAGRLWIALNGGSMDVETPSGLASVRGSNLMVWVDPATQNVHVSCFEGDCGAQNSTQSLNLSTGFGTILYHVETGNNPPPPASYQLSWQDFQDWANNNPDVQDILPSIIQTLTAIPPQFTPTFTVTPSPTATVTNTPTATAQACFNLTAPVNGSLLLANGAVTFAWSPMTGAEKYMITITDPQGTWKRYSLDTNIFWLEIGTFYTGGTYTWKVEAYDAAGKLLCTAPEFTFTKPVSPTATFPPPPTPTGNTVFTLNDTPTGVIICDGSTSPYFSVYVIDPDGVSSVAVYYQPSSGQPDVIPLVDTEVWHSTFAPLFYPGTIVDWYFEATDGLGNIEKSAQFQFTCQ